MRAGAARAAIAAALLASSPGAIAAAPQTPDNGAFVVPTDAEIRELLARRVDALGGEENGIGIVVGVIGPRGRSIVSRGRSGERDSPSLDGDTAFEIGSVTKVFTALLLADMARRGEVALDDPVSKHLPAGIEVPDRDGHPITLLDLATHTSGLPFMPDGLPAFDDPAAGYSVAQLVEFLARFEPRSEPGAQWDYSNIGYWLLGRALAARAGKGFEETLQARIIAPLGLKSTAITLHAGLQARLAVGHDAVLQPAPRFDAVPGYSLMPAAGGLVSTANDLLTVLGEFMGDESTALEPAISRMLATRRQAEGFEQALGWMVIGADDSELFFHDGGSFGYSSSVAWDPKSRVGVVVLSNQVTDVGDIARHLLRPEMPLENPTATKRSEIAVQAAVLETYAGRYRAEDEGPFVVAREGAFLTFQAPAGWGLPKLRLHAESARDFFAKELALRVTFRTAADGHSTEMLVHPPRGQRAITATRINAHP